MAPYRITVNVDAEQPLEVGLRDALQKCAASSASTYVLVLPTSARAGREIIDVLVKEATALPRGSELVIVHPSPSIGFLISSAALRIPHVKIGAVGSVLEAAGGETAPEGESALSTPVTGAAPDPALLRAQAVERAFTQAARNNKTACVIVLDPSRRPAADLVGLIETHARRNPTVRTIYLVHPLPVAGFLASTLGLRLPSMDIRAVTSMDQVET